MSIIASSFFFPQPIFVCSFFPRSILRGPHPPPRWLQQAICLDTHLHGPRYNAQGPSSSAQLTRAGVFFSLRLAAGTPPIASALLIMLVFVPLPVTRSLALGEELHEIRCHFVKNRLVAHSLNYREVCHRSDYEKKNAGNIALRRTR